MTFKSPIISIFLFLTIQSFQLIGQNQVSHAFTKAWKVEIVDLPGSGFEEMVQDSLGFMWIGTADGLLRYDGIHYKTYVHEPDNPNSLSSSNISRLYLQDERYLWVGTYNNGGLNRIDLVSGVIRHYLGNETIWEIIADSKGNIWAGSENGAFRLDPKSDSISHFLSFSTEMRNLIVWTIIEDKDGKIWAGGKTSDGQRRIWRFSPEINSFQKCDLKSDHKERSGTMVTSLLQDTHGTFWVGMNHGELYQMDCETSILELIDLIPTSDLKYNMISTIFEDLDHQIWIVTHQGLYKIDPLTHQQTYFSSNSPGHHIPTDVGWTICQSQDSVLWIGTGKIGGVVYKLFETAPQLMSIST